MLYGMSYIYGMTQSTNLTEILYAFPKYLAQPMGVFALVLTLTGFFFKLSLFPMHFWAPDIYEGASNTTTTFIATIPKIAAAAILIRITLVASSMNIQFVNILMVFAAISMTFGNLVGLVQKDVKRLLAYSGIAHAGYLSTWYFGTLQRWILLGDVLYYRISLHEPCRLLCCYPDLEKG